MNRAIFFLLAALLVLALVPACEEDPGYKGEGGIFDNPVSLTARWPYVYVTNENYDLSDDKEGKISIVDMRIALQQRNECIVNTVDTPPYMGEIVLTADGSLAYASNRRHNTVLVFDLTDPIRPEQIDMDSEDDGDQGIEVSSQPFGISLSPDESRLFVACTGSGNVSIVDLERNQLSKTIPLSFGVNDVKVDPAVEYVYATNRTQLSVVMLDAETGAFVTSFDPGYTLSLLGYDNRGMDFTPDGKKLFVAARNPGALLMVDTEKLPLYPEDAVLKLLPMDLSPTAVRVTPDGQEVWATNFDGNSVFVFEVETGNFLKFLRVGDGPYDLEIVENPNDPGHYYVLTANFRSHNVTLIDGRSKEVIWAIP